jgi:hypothetical protein
VRVLREAAGDVIAWCHPELGIVHAVVSQPMLLRADDPVLLVALIDVTEWIWTFGSDSTPHVFSSADRGINPSSTTGLKVVG